MQYKLVITYSAQNDILDASDWYENKSKGHGELYMLSIDKCVKLVLQNPHSFAVIYLQIRKANVNKYPYSLYYSFDEIKNEITIFAVIHQSRSEVTWKNRIDK